MYIFLLVYTCTHTYLLLFIYMCCRPLVCAGLYAPSIQYVYPIQHLHVHLHVCNLARPLGYCVYKGCLQSLCNSSAECIRIIIRLKWVPNTLFTTNFSIRSWFNHWSECWEFNDPIILCYICALVCMLLNWEATSYLDLTNYPLFQGWIRHVDVFG